MFSKIVFAFALSAVLSSASNAQSAIDTQYNIVLMSYGKAMARAEVCSFPDRDALKQMALLVFSKIENIDINAANKRLDDSQYVESGLTNPECDQESAAYWIADFRKKAMEFSQSISASQ